MSETPPPELPPTDLGPVQYDSPMTGDPNKDKFNWAAITALVIGCVNILSWCIPLCGCPCGIAGIVFGAIGLKSNKKGFAIAGIILSAISILFTLGNAIAGIWMQQNHKGIWAP